MVKQEGVEEHASTRRRRWHKSPGSGGENKAVTTGFAQQTVTADLAQHAVAGDLARRQHVTTVAELGGRPTGPDGDGTSDRRQATASDHIIIRHVQGAANSAIALRTGRSEELQKSSSKS